MDINDVEIVAIEKLTDYLFRKPASVFGVRASFPPEKHTEETQGINRIWSCQRKYAIWVQMFLYAFYELAKVI